MDTQLLEAQLLYSAVFTPAWIDELLTLDEKDFRTYRSLFQTVKKLASEGKTIDYSLVKTLDDSIDRAVLTVVSEDNLGMTIIPIKKIFEERVGALKEISIKRHIEASYINELDLDVLKAHLEKIYKKGQARWLTGEDIRNLAAEIIKNKKENSLTYHLTILDKATKGISQGQYVIVAGRPSVGKSAYLQFMGLKNAEKGKKVLLVSVEMSEEMIIGRIMQTYQPETIPSTFNILIASDTGTIEAEINKRGRDFDMILVDYIQLLKSKNKSRDLYERVTNISGELKAMATRFNLPFICASQFSRKAEGNQPNLADLKESGALEQDADVVISLYKDKKDDELVLDNSISTVRVDLLKNRNGWTFSNTDTKIYSVMFKKKEFTFHDIERREDGN